MTSTLFVDPLVGYRSWEVTSSYELAARVTKIVWPSDKKIVAGCNPRAYMRENGVTCPERHDSPDLRCECGLYAYHQLYDSLESYSNGDRAIVGAAVFWGNIEVFTAGFRAQYGRIVALADHRKRKDLGWPAILEKTVERYRVPLVPLSLLESYAETFGKSLGIDSLGD